MIKWQPIDSAPKDGTRVWAKRVHERFVVKKGWAVWGVMASDAPMRKGCLDESIPPDNEYADIPRWLTEDHRYAFPPPTHWQPLPAPPEGEL